MYPTPNPIAVNGNLLNEIAASGSFPDPMLFCYGMAAVLLVLFWSVGVLILGRSKKATDRPDRAVAAVKSETPCPEYADRASWQPRPQPTTGPQLQVR